MGVWHRDPRSIGGRMVGGAPAAASGAGPAGSASEAPGVRHIVLIALERRGSVWGSKSRIHGER